MPDYTLIQRTADEQYLDTVARAMNTQDIRSTTPDTRGRVQDYHKIDYSDFLSIANTEHTPISAVINRKEMARDIVHFWFEQYYPTTYRAPSDAVPTPVDEFHDPTDTAQITPVRFSNYMMKIGRSFQITDEARVIFQAGALLDAFNKDEWGRQMQANMTLMLRQQELAILKAGLNSSGTGARQMRGLMGDYLQNLNSTANYASGGGTALAGGTITTPGTTASGTTLTLPAPTITGGVQATATCTVAGSAITAFVLTGPGSGYIGPTITGTNGNGVVTFTVGKAGWYGPLVTNSGVLGTDYGAVEDRTTFDQLGKKLSFKGNPAGDTEPTVTFIETALNNALFSFYSLNAGPIPQTLYVPPRTINLLQAASSARVTLFMTQSELAAATAQNLGGVTGKFRSDFGTIDFIAHPLLIAANATPGTGTNLPANSRMLFLDMSNISLIDYVGFGGIHIEPRAKIDPTETRIMYEYISLELRQLLSHGQITNFYH